MYTLILALSALTAEPAWFSIDVDGPADTVILLNGKTRLQSGTLYETEGLQGEIEITLEFRFVEGERVRTEKQVLTLSPGFTHKFKITIRSHRTILNC